MFVYCLLEIRNFQKPHQFWLNTSAIKIITLCQVLMLCLTPKHLAYLPFSYFSELGNIKGCISACNERCLSSPL